MSTNTTTAPNPVIHWTIREESDGSFSIGVEDTTHEEGCEARYVNGVSPGEIFDGKEALRTVHEMVDEYLAR